ncbi:hypothetical protein BGZ90_007524, partial [Linnemannia elongata]
MAMAAGYPQSPPRGTTSARQQQQQPSQINFGTFAHHMMSLLENGNTAAKRRISKNMISEPKNFEHLIHTETEEEATIIFKEWMRNPSAGKLPENDESEGGSVGAGWDNDEIERSTVPSLSTVEQSSSTKIFFESYYHRLLTNPSGRSRRRLQLERQLETLGISEDDKAEMRQEWMANETEYMRLLREKISVNSFLILKTIGHGAFGVVKLVQEKDTGLYFAMKVMRKADMLKKGQEGHVRAERDLMTAASESAVWIVKLIYSFQDADHLYLVMEYMSGGDLLNLLIEKDIFEEDFAKFYVAEMVLCIEEAHKLGYIHRDIKPDNFLFNKEGHIKLSDFGLATDFHWAHDTAYYESQRRALLRKT